MSNETMLYIFRKKLTVLVLSGLVLAAASFLILLFSQKNFKASTDFLVVQNQTNNQDFYTLSKSAEYLGKVLSESIYSETFIDEIIKTGKVDSGFLPFDKKQRLEEWAKKIKMSRNLELGVITIVVYSDSQDEALRISAAIADVYTMKNNLFRGEGEGVNVRILSGPIVEKNPTVKEIVILVIVGFMAGFFLALMWIYYKTSFGNTTSNATGKKERNYESVVVFNDSEDYAKSLENYKNWENKISGSE